MNNIEKVTFNSYGDLNKVIQNKANKLGETIKINPEKLINYRHENDVLSEKKNIGYNYDVLNYGQNAKTNIFGSHDIKNTGQTINRKPNVNVYHEKTIYYPKINLQQKQLKEQEVVVKSPIDINITE